MCSGHCIERGEACYLNKCATKYVENNGHVGVDRRGGERSYVMPDSRHIKFSGGEILAVKHVASGPNWKPVWI